MERIIMLKIKEYTKVESLEEAYQLNQKRTACLIGGMVWLKMGNRNVSMAIDLSGLGLDTIEEDENEFRIGCMTSLRSLELHKGLADYTNGAMRESVRHIVGVQFRNCATVGGSIFGRYGFSDVLTMFLAMDSYVELYKGGIIPMKEFAQMKKEVVLTGMADRIEIWSKEKWIENNSYEDMDDIAASMQELGLSI